MEGPGTFDESGGYASGNGKRRVLSHKKHLSQDHTPQTRTRQTSKKRIIQDTFTNPQSYIHSN